MDAQSADPVSLASPAGKFEPDSRALVNGPGEPSPRNRLRRAHRTPVPPQRWHLTTLSPFFKRPLPSQFLHFCFFLMFGPFSLAMMIPPAKRCAGITMVQSRFGVYKHA